MSRIKILLVEPQKLLRESWSYLLNSDERFHVIASCDNSEEAISLAHKKRPHIVLIDPFVKPLAGFMTTKKIREVSPASRVIGLSSNSQPADVKKMLKSGARGYVSKRSSKQEVLQAILEVSTGKKFLCGEIKAMIANFSLAHASELPDITCLTTRERQIIRNIREGLSSKEIAAKLDLATNTIESHRYNILKKLHIKNSASLVNFYNSHDTSI